MVVDNPDWRGLATGNFNQNTNDWTDVSFRFLTIGQQSAWFLSANLFVGATYLKPEPDPAWRLYSQDWFQSTWRHKDIFPSISATPSSSSIVLNFRIKPFVQGNTTYGVKIRRREVGGNWSNPDPLDMGVPTDAQGYGSYTDDNFEGPGPTPGMFYEYEVVREGETPADKLYYPARVITGTGLSVSRMENRGKILVIVDTNVAPNIASSLNAFTDDLVGDGWTVVVKNDAPRHNDAILECSPGSGIYRTAADGTNKTNRENLKAWIRTHSDAKGIILVGHVTVPFSGGTGGAAPDAHGDHEGAWVADMWYGDMGDDALWTDGTGATECSVLLRFPHNFNRTNDGKFEKAFPPSGVTMFVGRIDFARLPLWNTGNEPSQPEYDLLTPVFWQESYLSN
ncbi:MAG: hypothetical protein HY735_00765 [Verrucomicrobia bacterium]|nr:hypothetical protein [Verrucomicrobiota bacterium]